MSLIEQAEKRLEELKRAGVAAVPTFQEESIPEVAQVEPSRQTHAGTVHRDEANYKHSKSVQQTAFPSNVAKNADSSMSLSRRVAIDLTQLAAKNIVTPNDPRSRVADEFRVLKRPLLGNAKDKRPASVENGNLIMVTSSLPGEGKTFTAINLAMSIAMEMDNTVLLVDADVARPSVLKYLGLPSSKGLMDVLLDEKLDLSDVLLRTNVEKLSLLPGGTGHQHATELLASDSMAKLIGEMASRYSDRIIIFDSPPLLVTTESRVLATHMGQIVVVVEAEKTLNAVLKQALSTIESCPLVLTMLNKSIGASSAGLGYGYGYGGYGYAGE
jgi:protein-tyrosine kinase